MAERRPYGLQRVLGVNALFSTAYGNVGSSIYYALGLVASFALGLTPVVFVLTGIIFYLTAATYAEATAMFPEAGGSSSFARHAFNEFWSFFAAWGQMLNYVITIAISAFFVPHYIGGLFWPFLKTSPGDIFFGIGVIAVLSAINVVGVKEAARLNIVLAITDFSTQLLLVVVGGVLVFSPHILISNIHLGTAPHWKDFLVAIPVGMIAYTGIETISNMAEEAKDEAHTIPAAIMRVVLAVFVIYAALPSVALSALPVRCVHGLCQTPLGVRRTRAGSPETPSSASSAPPSRAAATCGRDLRRAAGRDDPLDCHQRRNHRRLAARLLHGPAPPAPRPAARAPSQVPDAVDRNPRVRRDRVPDPDPRTSHVPGQHLRVRGDALLHDRARLGDPPAAQRPDATSAVSRSRHAPGSPAASFPCSLCSVGSEPSSRSSP